jgi:hypothetical protein
MNRPAVVRALVLASIVGLAATACGGKSNASPPPSTTTSTTSTTTTAPPAPDAPKEPLTGLPSGDPGSLNRPALMVKIDNADSGDCANTARPQVGLEQADIVYDILVEGITRFAAVFHSQMPETVGPVRSARSSDIDIIAQFGKPLLAWSGNNGNVQQELDRAADTFVNVGHGSSAGGNFYRDKKRCAPHNLFVNPADLYEFAKDKGGGTPTPIFNYRADGEALPATAHPAPGVRLTTGQDEVYAWNGGTKSWDRYQKGKAFTTANDTLISPTNVVVLEVDYPSSSTAGSPEAVTVGDGPAHIYTDGAVIDGTWKRDSASAPWTLTDTAGTPIKLTPGKTWVSLSQKGRVEPLDADQVTKSIA